MIKYKMIGDYAIITNPNIISSSKGRYRKCKVCGLEYNISRGGEAEKMRNFVCYKCTGKERRV